MTTTGWDGCSTFSHLGNLGHFLSLTSFCGVSLTGCSQEVAVGTVVTLGDSAPSNGPDGSLGGSYTFKDFSVQKGEVTPHLLLQLLHKF